MTREMWSAYMRADVRQIPLLLLMNDRPCFYLGALHHLGHLFGLDLTGAVINHSGQPLTLRAPMPRMLQHNTEEASAEMGVHGWHGGAALYAGPLLVAGQHACYRCHRARRLFLLVVHAGLWNGPWTLHCALCYDTAVGAQSWLYWLLSQVGAL